MSGLLLVQKQRSDHWIGTCNEYYADQYWTDELNKHYPKLTEQALSKSFIPLFELFDGVSCFPNVSKKQADQEPP